MTARIDEESATNLRSLFGQTIRQISGLRYPAVASYSEVQLTTSKQTFSVTLRIHDMSDELEVCVPVVKLLARAEPPAHADTFDVYGFQIAEISILQRRETLGWAAESTADYVGTEPREQHFLEIDPGDDAGVDLVDAGIAFTSSNGITLELCADTFPLVFQLRLSVAASALPNSRRIALK